MKTLGIWMLLLIIVIIVSMDEAEAKKKKKDVRIRIDIKVGKKKGGRGRRDTQQTLDVNLPCRFEMYDTNKDGHASLQEVSSLLAKFDPGLETADILNAVFQNLDMNGDGMLQIEEFHSNLEYQKNCVFAETLKDKLKGQLEGVAKRKNTA